MTAPPTPPPADAAPAAGATAPHASGRERLAVLVAGAVILALPAVVLSVVWTPAATSPLLLGGIVGALSALSLGWRLALIEVLILFFAVPVAVVAGQVPIAGAGVMALLCLFTGLTSFWGMHTAFRMVPLVLAYPMIHPPALGDLAPDRDSTTYLIGLAALMAGGALWMVLVLTFASRHRELPALQSAGRAQAIGYTIAMTVLVTANTFAVLTVNPSSQGAWLILTLIVVTQPGPKDTMRRSVYRVVGTVVGAGVASLIATVVTDPGWQQLVALVAIVVALYFRTAAYWVYVSLLTPAVVLLSSTGDVLQTGEQRLLYTAVGACQVVLAGALTLGYLRLRGHTPASGADLTPQPLAAAPDAD